MANIYQIGGQSVYDYGGKVINAKTGEEYVNPNANFNYGAKPISVSTLTTPQTPITTPTQPTDTTDYNAGIADGTARIGATDLTPIVPPETSGISDTTARIQKILGQYQAAPTLETGVAETERAASLAATRATRAAQAELAGIQAQVQAVISKRDAQNLALERDASGRLITGAVLGRQQQEINRQAAIEALPLQALALAAQAKVQGLQGEEEFAQSTLKAAQDKLDTAFKYQYEKDKNKVDLWNNQLDKIWTTLDAQEKERATTMKDAITRNQSAITDVRNAAQTAFQTASTNGQADLYAKFIQLPMPDPMSKTFAADLKNYNTEIAKLQGQVKPKPEKKTAAEIAAGQPISVLDVARYNELYPEAGVMAGDTEAQANAKVTAINTPEAKIRNLITAAQTAGNSYDTVVKEINTDTTIKDKKTALSIAKEVYGISETPVSKIDQEIAAAKARFANIPNLPPKIDINNEIKQSLLKKGYTNQDIVDSSLGSGLDKFVTGISKFLFGK